MKRPCFEPTDNAEAKQKLPNPKRYLKSNPKSPTNQQTNINQATKPLPLFSSHFHLTFFKQTNKPTNQPTHPIRPALRQGNNPMGMVPLRKLIASTANAYVKSVELCTSPSKLDDCDTEAPVGGCFFFFFFKLITYY